MTGRLAEARQAPLRVRLAEGGSEAVEAPSLRGRRSFKLLCTLGPKCQDAVSLERLLDEGVDAFRLDFCFERREAQAETLRRLRHTAAARGGRQVAVILDLKGPEVRTGLLKDGQSVDLEAGNRLTLVTDMSVEGDADRVAVDLEQLPCLVQLGDRLLLADGALSLEVLSHGFGEIETRILNSGRLGERSSCWLHGLEDVPDAPEDVFRAVVSFGIPQEVDFVVASCARSRQDVRHLREVLGERGRHVGVLAKIGCEAGLENVDEIVRESDGVIIASGDLGMRIPQEKVFLAQKAIIAKCNVAGKPVIVASQLQESTRGCREASAAANAVLDGADGVLLSDDTALSDFPEAAVATLRRSCEAAEAAMDCRAWPSSALRWQPQPEKGSPEAAGLSAVEAARNMRARLLLVLTVTGQLAHAVTRLRPTMPVLAITGSGRAARKMQVLRGISALLLEDLPEDTQAAMDTMVKAAEQGGWVRRGDVVVAVRGEPREDDMGPAYEIDTLVVGGAGVPPPPAEGPEVGGYKLEQCKVSLEDSLDGLASFEEASQEAAAASESGLGLGEQDQRQGRGGASSMMPNRSKIMCSVGPKSWSMESLLRLMDAGMDVCRMDVATGDLSVLAACVRRVRYAASLRRERTIAIQLDVHFSDLCEGLFQIGQSLDLQAVDFLAICAETAADVQRAREALASISQGIMIMAKIATKTGLRNFDEILNESDGILVAGSELGSEIPAEKVFLAQKLLIRKCNVAGKPVVATTSLTSMSTAPRPTPAETSALANVVLDGADCVALEDETAVGKFPEAAVRAARRLCEEAVRAVGAVELGELSLEAKPAAEAAELARSSGAGLVALECKEVGEVLEVVRLGPGVAVLAATREERLARQLAVVRGVVPVRMEATTMDTGMEAAMLDAVREARRRRLLQRGEAAVLLRGSAVRLVADLGDALEEDDFCLEGVRRLRQVVPELPQLRSRAIGAPSLAGDAVVQAAAALSARLSKATAAAAAVTGLPDWGLLSLASSVVGSLKAHVQSRTLLVSPREELGVRFLEENQERVGVVVLASGLQHKVLCKGGSKDRPSLETACLWHYEGRVAQHWPAGPAFVSTYDKGEPQELTPGEVIQGLAEAMQLMTEGDKWEVYIPPALGYGEHGSPPHIEGGDVLVFILELVQVTVAPSSPLLAPRSTQQMELDRRRLLQVPTPRFTTGPSPHREQVQDPSPNYENNASTIYEKLANLGASFIENKVHTTPTEKYPCRNHEKVPTPRCEIDVSSRLEKAQSLPTFMDEKQEPVIAFAGSQKEAFLRSTESAKELARKIDHLSQQDITPAQPVDASPARLIPHFSGNLWPVLGQRQKSEDLAPARSPSQAAVPTLQVNTRQ